MIDYNNIPLPGLYADIPAQDYHSWFAASNSLLSEMLVTPAHCKIAMDRVSEPTPAMTFGSAVHAAILEPSLFETTWGSLPPDLDGRTKEGKAQKAALLETYGDRLLSDDSMQKLRNIVKTVRAHPSAAYLLDSASAHEISAVWRSGQADVLCKARFDSYCRELGIICDLKTTDDVSTAALERSIFNFGYHRQSAHYLEAAQVLDLNLDKFVFIFVEKSEPHSVRVLELHADAILAGRAQLDRTLIKWKSCLASGIYPGYSDQIEVINLPSYAINQINNEAVND